MSVNDSVKNHQDNREIIEEAKRLLEKYGSLDKIPKEALFNSKFKALELFRFCQYFDSVKPIAIN